MTTTKIHNHANLIWGVAELLRGDYKQSEYQKVILPLTVLRRLDCVLEPTKDRVLATYQSLKDRGIQNVDAVLTRVSGEQFYNVSPLTFTKLLDDSANIADNLEAYIAGFSESAREIIDKFNFAPQIDRLRKANLLYMVVGAFADIDLHPDKVSNLEMGYLYEELVRKFSELSNETAGEHFTPREVIRLIVDLLFSEDDDMLVREGVVKTIYDPACGTGGMLSVGQEYLRELNPKAELIPFGQELNDETYAICRSDMMLKGQDASNIISGNSFTDDGHRGRRFDYMLANPPFGVDWKKYAAPIEKEHKDLGFDGRFGAGLPRKSDGSMLFLQHMISKMKPVEDGGSRIGIVFNASPLFTGAAGGGESEIRRWIIENDWLEAIVALPEQLFYNTGIATYVWIVTNRKAPHRVGKVQLVDAREMWEPMRKSLGEKRRWIPDEKIAEIVQLYTDFDEGDHVKLFPNHHFGYMRVTVEQPLRLKWSVTDGTVEVLKAHKSFERLAKDKKGEEAGSGAERQKALIEATEALRSDIEYDVFSDVWKLFRKELEARDISADAAMKKLMWEVTSLRDPDAPAQTDKKGNPDADPELRDYENIPLPVAASGFEQDFERRLTDETHREAIERYVAAEVHPWVSDAWVDHSKAKIGYVIGFAQEFHSAEELRPLREIDEQIEKLESRILMLLTEVKK